MEKTFIEIAIALPIEQIFTYEVPEALTNDAAIGKRVLVPFGKRTLTGYVLRLTNSAPLDVEIKPILDILDAESIFDQKRLEFYRWLSSYYFSPLGEVLALIHPGNSNIQSKRHLKTTPEGLSSGLEGIEAEVLSSAKDGITLSALIKRFKNKPVYSVTERLKKKGLLEEETLLKGGVSKRTERYAKISSPCPAESLKRSPIQAKVHNYLLANGESPLSALRNELGNINEAVNRLQAKGIISISEKQVLRDPLSEIAPKATPFEPNPEQAAAINEITASLRTGGFNPYLLYGVTGSGKTLVYLKILEEAVRLGKKAIILAPEIALTPWPAAYLADKFPGRIALAHSGLSEGERADEWERILKGEADIVVGARSALFSPVKNLGLIIIDEEHESSYKQEDSVKYNARDAALALGKTLGITVVLGSATPSIETFYNSLTGKLKPLYMKKRAAERELPKVELLDMKGKKGVVISGELKGLMEEAFEGGHQAILFLNRRGFSNFIICKDCGQTFSCLNCSVTLTMHKRNRVLKCHYCDMTADLPEECPSCKGLNLAHPGLGTEKVEEEVRALFPDARIGRMDRDTTSKKGSVNRIIDAVEERKVDCLIGTQMVSKGHHFPGVTLVGVISGDTSLNIPDFRSSERTFQLITQAAGRAGRGDVSGKVVIQTLNPDHYCFRNAVLHDYDGFYKEEIAIREDAFYPPFSRLCNLKIEASKEPTALKAATILREIADRLLKGKNLEISVLGPAPAPVAKVKNRYRRHMLIKAKEIKDLHSFIKGLKAAFETKKPSNATLIIDMDPANIL